MSVAREALAAYEAHRAAAVALKAAYELGCALADAMDRKALKVRYGRPVFEDETGAFRALLEAMLDRGKMFRTGGWRLRQLLDAAVIRHVDRATEATLSESPDHQSIMSLYFGWKFVKTTRLSPCPWMTLGDAHALRRFADALDAAMDLVRRVRKTSWPCESCDGTRDRWGSWSTCDCRDVDNILRCYSGTVKVFRGVYEQMCAQRIQRAWRRARDTPGFAVWRQRMLREFNELMTL